MIQKFFVDGVLPGENEIIGAARKHYQRYATMKRDYTQIVALTIRRAKLKSMKQAGVVFYWCVQVNRDPDNVAAAQKFILDALVWEKVLKNDGQKEILYLHHEYRPGGKPGVEVVLNDKLLSL